MLLAHNGSATTGLIQARYLTPPWSSSSSTDKGWLGQCPTSDLFAYCYLKAVDFYGTGTVKRTMAPKKNHAKRPSVNTMLKFTDELNHHPNLDHVNDWPEALKPILVLINQTRLGYDDLNPQLEDQEFNASHIYEKQRNVSEMQRPRSEPPIRVQMAERHDPPCVSVFEQ